MKKIQNLLFVLLVVTVNCFSDDTNTTQSVEDDYQSTMAFINRDVNSTETNSSVDGLTTLNIAEPIDTVDNNDTNQSLVDTNATVEIADTTTDNGRKFSRFEKTFVYHVAYNNYLKAIELMYAGQHKNAYEAAMKSKDIYKNNEENKIALPYMPGYIRENAQTPRRIYYKIIEEQNYELTRLIRKIKLLSPPIPMIVLSKTSTYIDITVQNVGDLPLDKFGIEINYENVVVFDKIEPNQSKTYRYNKAIPLEQISFTEEYGFAPMPIEFTVQEEQ